MEGETTMHIKNKRQTEDAKRNQVTNSKNGESDKSEEEGQQAIIRL